MQNIHTEPIRDEHILSLGSLFRVLWKRLWLIALVVIIVVGAALGLSLAWPPTYKASIKLFIGQNENTVAPGSLGGDVPGLQQFTSTLTTLVDSDPVAEAVIRRLDLQIAPEDFLDNLSAEQVMGTQIIEVSYEDSSPERAQRVANAVGSVFTEQVSEIRPNNGGVTATVWETAAVPSRPESPDLLLNLLVALVVGTTLAVCLAFLLEYLDDSWHSPEEPEQISGAPTLGVIPEYEALNASAPKAIKKASN